MGGTRRYVEKIDIVCLERALIISLERALMISLERAWLNSPLWKAHVHAMFMILYIESLC